MNGCFPEFNILSKLFPHNYIINKTCIFSFLSSIDHLILSFFLKTFSAKHGLS